MKIIFAIGQRNAEKLFISDMAIGNPVYIDSEAARNAIRRALSIEIDAAIGGKRYGAAAFWAFRNVRKDVIDLSAMGAFES